ncbi:unnamed protein product, partial [Closterium sp. NIES-53]
MPFGLTNAPATFQMTMNEAFRSLLDKCVIIYLDDILVYIRDKQQHLEDLEAVFTVLDKHRLLTKGSKCEFFQDRLEFLGHVISEAGVEIDPKKLDTVKAWHPPTNITELQSFLGFVNYVRRFVSDMARLTAPLTDLLRKGVTFTWGEKEHAAFSTLKHVLCSPPVLRIADPHRPFEVVTDASDIAIGAVLLQDFSNGLQPIAYESRKLHPPEKNYLIHDREMLAIVHAFKVWRCYLTGADVTVRTDHKSLHTSGMGLVLGGRRPVVLTGHADASWADDQATQRSSQGYSFSLGSGSVSWRSTRSSSVLSSSCEAEIYAGAMAAQELRWLTYLLTDLGEQPRSPPVLYVDNKAMLALCREHRLEHRMKHIALRYFLARELQQRGQLRLAYVASEANTADIFTKALAPGDHQRFCTLLACFALLDWSCDPLFSPTLPMG